MTRSIRDAAKGVNIALHDHIIVAKSGTVSFVDQGLL
jgi:DNA repair protein RadC